MTLKRDYYTIKETANLIDSYSLNDIYHFIETKKLKPTLYTPKRRYIAVTWDQENKQFIAHATCLYQGLLQTNQDVIDSLLDKGEIILSTVSKPLNPLNISHWNSRYPYTSKNPNLAFSTWHPYPSLNEETLKNNLYLIPFPTERKSILSTLNEVMDNLEKAGHLTPNLHEKKELSEKHRYAYDFHENGVFSKDSLRLIQEDITTLTHKHKPRKDISEGSLPWSTSKKGGYLINEKIEHIYRQNHTESTTQLWRRMETLYNENYFDSVIDRVTSDEISWVSRKKVEKITTYNAFEKKVSQIRVFYRENSIQIQE